MIRTLVTIFALLAAPVFAANPPTTADLLRSLHLDPGFRQDLRSRGYTGERFEIMVEHTRLLYSDREIIGGLERRIADVLERNGFQVNNALGLFLDAMMSQAYSDGLTRLKPNERAQLFSVDAGFFRAIPTRDCNRILNDRLSGERTQKVFDAYMVQLSPAVLRNYHAATRAAMRQGLSSTRKAQTLNAAEIRAIEEVIFPAVDRIIGAQKHADKLYDAWSGGPAKAGRYACSFNQIFSGAVLNLQGSTRDKAILYMMTQ